MKRRRITPVPPRLHPDASTPYERMFGSKPDLSKARVFGSKAWLYLDKEQREHKLSETATEGKFVGFTANGAGYRVYANGRFYDGKFVRFEESGVLSDAPEAVDDSAAAPADTALDGLEPEPAAPEHEDEAGAGGWCVPTAFALTRLQTLNNAGP